MRFLTAIGFVAALTATACGGSTSSPTSPAAAGTMTGTWVGSASDSTGSMMGAGASASMMGNTTWTLTQTGTTFAGTMQFPGYPGGTMMVSGNTATRSGTFTMTIPAGSMMTGACAATATGTFDMDDMMTQLHATYTGTNSCGGPFDRGQMSMLHR